MTLRHLLLAAALVWPFAAAGVTYALAMTIARRSREDCPQCQLHIGAAGVEHVDH